MIGTHRSRRGSHALRKRCPECGKVRKFSEPDGSQGGEDHPRRMDWLKDPTGRWVCGWCVLRAEGQASFTATGGMRSDFRVRIVRDVRTGRILERERMESR